MQMSDQRYVRLTKTLNNKGILVKPDEVLKHITDRKIDHYTSTYFYNQSHFDEFQKSGSVKGFTGVTTNKIWWDFDSKDDLKLARKDAITLVDRLIDKNIDVSALEIFFSGNKGFNVVLNLNKDLNRKQVETVALKLAKDLKTFDTTLYDESQLLRVVATKHQNSEYYKTEMTFNELQTIKFADLFENAKKPNHSSRPTVKVDLSDDLFEVEEVKQEFKTNAEAEFDLNNKPRGWKASKWALMQGFIKSGERDNSMMILAATCKATGYDNITTYYMCKSALKKSWERYGQGDFTKEDLWAKIEQVYSSNWKGGQYSEKEDAFLQQKSTELGIKELTTNNTVGIRGGLKVLKGYAQNIDSLTLKTGIVELDRKQRITVGMSWGIIAGPGSGKCLGIDTPVMMFDGSIKMVQDIIPGDKLMGDDSKERNVLSTCTGKEQLYKIHQDNGNSYIVNESHILSLKGGYTPNSSARNTKYNYGTFHDLELNDYLKGSKRSLKYLKGYKVPVEFKEQSTPLDPYFFGYWLGDGTSTKPEITVGKQDIEMFSVFKQYAKDLKLGYSIVQDRQCYRFSFKKLQRDNKKHIISLNLPENKIIPDSYLINSRNNRLKLLAGLIDSDGHYSSSHYYEITQKNIKLAEQIVYLCRSLGFKTTIKQSEKYCYYKGEKRAGIYNRISFTGEDLTQIPVKCPRKKAIKFDRQRYNDLTKIKVEKLKVGNYYGFEIDGNKRFLLGDFTVTHNTSLALQMLHSMSLNGELCIYFSYDMYLPHVIQKIIQKHWPEDIEVVFDKYKNNDFEYVKKVEELITKEYPNVEFCAESGQTIEDIRDTIREVEQARGKKCRFVVIDYNELVITDVSDPTQSSNKTAQNIRALASNEQICILSLFQPSKNTGDPSSEITSYRAAKGGSGIEQSVSLMFGVSRPGFNPREPQKDKYVSMNCVKNRMGSVFSIDLHWEGYKGIVRSLSPQEKSELAALRKAIEDEKNGKSDDDSWS